MPFVRAVSLSPGHIVLDGYPAPLPQMNTAPQFSDQVCFGETAGWIKMPLGREVGLGQGHGVLDGDPAPLQAQVQVQVFIDTLANNLIKRKKV